MSVILNAGAGDLHFPHMHKLGLRALEGKIISEYWINTFNKTATIKRNKLADYLKCP